MTDDDLITLDEGAKLIPGADANTLKRMRRKGVLTCYRPGKAYLTTANDVREAVKSCKVGQKIRGPNTQTDTDLANAALAALLSGIKSPSKNEDEFDAWKRQHDARKRKR